MIFMKKSCPVSLQAQFYSVSVVKHVELYCLQYSLLSVTNQFLWHCSILFGHININNLH